MFNVHNRCEKEESDWEGSWKVQSFDEVSWRDVAEQTHREFDEAFAWYSKQAESTEDLAVEDEAMSYIANIAHAAYHLGAIRALLPIVQHVG